MYKISKLFHEDIRSNAVYGITKEETVFYLSQNKNGHFRIAKKSGVESISIPTFRLLDIPNLEKVLSKLLIQAAQHHRPKPLKAVSVSDAYTNVQKLFWTMKHSTYFGHMVNFIIGHPKHQSEIQKFRKAYCITDELDEDTLLLTDLPEQFSRSVRPKMGYAGFIILVPKLIEQVKIIPN